MAVIAVDFGTSRTKVAYLPTGGGRPELLRFGEEEDRTYTPSLFYLSRSDEVVRVLFGDAAEEMLEEDPAGIVEVSKRRLRDARVRANGCTVSPAELLVAMLRAIRTKAGREIAAFAGVPPEGAVLTVPASWGPSERELMQAAAGEAGFTEMTLLDEPVTAAQAWLTEGGTAVSNVVVLDCGGGTVDWAHLRRTDGSLTLDAACPPGGLEGLGGHDVDLGLLELLEHELAAQGAESSELRMRRPRLLARLRRVKEAVARGRESSPIRLGSVTVTLAPEEVRDVMRSRLITRAVDGLRGYLERVKTGNESELPPVLLVGGSARLPGVKEAVEALGAKVVSWDRADYAAVLGALVASIPASLSEPAGVSRVTAVSVTHAGQLSPFSRSKTIIVDAYGRGDTTDLKGAVRDAEPYTTIIVRPGQYRANLVIDKPVEIIGEGEREFIVIDGFGGITITFNAILGCISGISLKNTSENSDVIRATFGRFIIENCDIQTSKNCKIVIRGNTEPFIYRSRIHGAQIYLNISHKSKATIEYNDISGHRRACIWVSSGDPMIRYNKIHGSESCGITIFGEGHSVIEDNDISGHDKICIMVSRNAETIIRRNKICSSKDNGISVGSKVHSIIEYNDISGHDVACINVSNDATSMIRRNKIHDSKGIGIQSHGESHSVIEYNDISGHDVACINVSNDATSMIRRNKIHDSKGIGIRTDGKSHNVIEDNDISGHKKACIRVLTFAEDMIHLNNIHDAEGPGIKISCWSRGIISQNHIWNTHGKAIDPPWWYKMIVQDNLLKAP